MNLKHVSTPEDTFTVLLRFLYIANKRFLAHSIFLFHQRTNESFLCAIIWRDISILFFFFNSDLDRVPAIICFMLNKYWMVDHVDSKVDLPIAIFAWTHSSQGMQLSVYIILRTICQHLWRRKLVFTITNFVEENDNIYMFPITKNSWCWAASQ